MRLDLHVHTSYSAYGRWKYDAIGSPRRVINRARQVGLDCIAITDHDTVKGAIEAQEIAQDVDGIDVVPGIEVTSDEGHILGLNVSTPIPTGLSASETVEAIHDRGGLAVAAHPGRSSGVSPEADTGFDAIEAWNARTNRRNNATAERLADELGLPAIATSDAHHWKDVGRAYTVVEGTDALSGVEIGPVELVRGRLSKTAFCRLYAAKLLHNLLR